MKISSATDFYSTRSAKHSRTGAVMYNVQKILLVLALVGAGVYASYLWQHKQVDDLNQQVTQLTSQLSDTRAKLSQQSKSQSAQPVAPKPTVSTSFTSAKGITVSVYLPARDSTVVSPVAVLGTVPGNWSFEASFPVKLLDSSSKTIATGTGQLLGDWMTEKQVPFSTKLTFTSSYHGNATLVLQKDNPSGLPANDDSVSIPVKL